MFLFAHMKQLELIEMQIAFLVRSATIDLAVVARIMSIWVSLPKNDV